MTCVRVIVCVCVCVCASVSACVCEGVCGHTGATGGSECNLTHQRPQMQEGRRRRGRGSQARTSKARTSAASLAQPCPQIDPGMVCVLF